MNKYEELLIVAEKHGIKVTEKDMACKGLYGDGEIWISSRLTTAEKAGILAEEIGHHLTSCGDITDQTLLCNIKQEHIARTYGYETFIPADVLRRALNDGCETLYDLSEYLGFDEEFCKKTIEHYQSKYGPEYIIKSHKPDVIYDIKKIGFMTLDKQTIKIGTIDDLDWLRRLLNYVD